MLKKTIIKMVTMVVIFLATLFLVNKIDNAGIHDVTAEMEQATLPVVFMEYNGEQVNCLHGYKQDMNIALMHDTITPIAEDKKVSMQVTQYGDNIQGASYEVRSVDGSSLIEEGEIENQTEKNGIMYLNTNIRMNLEAMTEYTYVLKLQLKSNIELRYYARIIISDSLNLEDYINFANTFCEATFTKNNPAAINKYIEPDKTGNNENLAHIDIHSNYETITWANLAPQRISQIIPTIKEIDGENAVIQFKYVIISGNRDDTQYYNIDEIYRLRRKESDGSMYLMDYDRYQETIFNRFNVNTNKNWYQIGIADKTEFQYRISDENEKVAFVREGQLWYYDYSKTNITKVFSFWDDSPTDIRTTYDNHDVNIIKFDDDGNITFTVYGYMNRGEHEGENGIILYQFHAATSKLEELLFVNTNIPYEVLREDASRLAYLNNKQEFFYLLNDGIVRVNLDTLKSDYIIEEMPKELIGVSANEKLVAYPDTSDAGAATKITILNLENYDTNEIEATAGRKIRALGFIDNDLVYGTAQDTDVVHNVDGSTIFAMDTLRIATLKDEVVKEYSKSGMYVVDATITNKDIYLKRVTKNGDNYVDADSDFITFKEEDTTGINVCYQYAFDAYNEVYIVFPNYLYVKNIPKIVITKQVVSKEEREIETNQQVAAKRYYVYAQGSMVGSYATARLAMLAANEASGVAIDSDGNCIWRISGLLDYATVAEDIETRPCRNGEDSLAACIQMIVDYEGTSVDETEVLQGQGAIDERLGKYLNKSGVNLVGCDINTALYYLCKQAPIIARYDQDTYVLIISFNASTIRYYNPKTGEEVREDRNVVQGKFEAEGNEFYSYVH